MPPSPTRPAPFYLSLGAGLFLGVFLLRLVVLVRLTGSQFLLPDAGDMRFYNDWALRILRGEWTTHTAFYGLPLYAYLLAAFYKIAGYSPFIPGLMQAALEGGTAVLLYKISGAVFGSSNAPEARAGVVAGGVDPGIPAAQAERGRGRQRARRSSACSQPSGGRSFNRRKRIRSSSCRRSWLVFIFWFVVWQVVRRNQSPHVLGPGFVWRIDRPYGDGHRDGSLPRSDSCRGNLLKVAGAALRRFIGSVACRR